MKHNMWKRILSSALCLSLLAGLSGCAMKTSKVEIEPMEAEESYALSFDFIGGKDVMPVGGFYGPYTAAYAPNAQPLPDFYTDEYAADIAAAGVNLIVYSPSDWSGSEGQKMLDLGEKHGIGVFINDHSIYNMKGKDNELSVEVISEKVAQYRNHPAFCGMYLKDEPGGLTYWTKGAGENIDDYAPLAKVLHEDLGVEHYTNLIRINTKEDTEDYEGYIKEYCEKLSPSFVCFDLYPFDDGNTRNIYLYNMALVRDGAMQYNLPFWTYIAAGTYWDDDVKGIIAGEPKPLEGQFDWSINSALAFGTQGLNYFMIIQPQFFSLTPDSEVFDFERNGFFGARGNKNRWYFYAQDIAKQIQAVDGVLMNSVSKGVIASGKDATTDVADCKNIVIKEGTWRELAGVEGNTIVGCFNYQGKSAFYVVNHDCEYAQDITLDFYDSYNLQVIQDGETKYVNADSLTLQMKAGDGALIVVQ